MPRKSNWPALLTLFIEEKRTQPFDWVHNNCCFFAADWICILTGTDPVRDYRALVTGPSAALELMAATPVEQRIAERCAFYGWPEIPPRKAQRGDIATVATPQGPAVGVVLGQQVAYAGGDGIVMEPINKALRAWRIG